MAGITNKPGRRQKQTEIFQDDDGDDDDDDEVCNLRNQEGADRLGLKSRKSVESAKAKAKAR